MSEGAQMTPEKKPVRLSRTHDWCTCPFLLGSQPPLQDWWQRVSEMSCFLPLFFLCERESTSSNPFFIILPLSSHYITPSSHSQAHILKTVEICPSTSVTMIVCQRWVVTQIRHRPVGTRFSKQSTPPTTAAVTWS